MRSAALHARILCAAAVVSLTLSFSARTSQASPPNRVDISERLVTSGQPSAETLAGLAAQGFEAVVYLAPPTVPDAVREEAVIVGRQGITFVNIPIKFDSPTERDFETFAAVMSALSARKVLVHCQINLRASSMVFLYRVISRKEDPRTAYEAVARIWSPNAAWKTLMQTLLRKHGVAFDPY